MLTGSLPPPHQQVLLDVVDEDVELPHGFVDPVLIHLLERLLDLLDGFAPLLAGEEAVLQR